MNCPVKNQGIISLNQKLETELTSAS